MPTLISFLGENPFLSLFASLFLLAAGPALLKVSKTHKSILEFLDGFTLVAIVGLVVLHILPHSLESNGWAAVALILISFILPNLLERVSSKVAKKTHVLTLWLAVIGMALHNFVDGLALGNTDPTAQSGLLATAVILHQLPVGMALWSVVMPLAGNRASVRLVGIVCLTTVLGFFFGRTVLADLGHTWLGLFEAIVGGSLLHVVFHKAHDHGAEDCCETDHDHGAKWKWAEGLGALFAFAALVLFERAAPVPILSQEFGPSIQVFLQFAKESAPTLLFAFAISGLIPAFLKPLSPKTLMGGTPVVQAGKGIAYGFPLPFCSCGIVPLFRSLVLKGLPATAAIALLISTPEGPDAVLLTLPLLGWKFMVLRIVSAFSIAFIVAVLLGKYFDAHLKKRSGAQIDTEHVLQNTFAKKITQAMRIGFFDRMDETGPWILVGLITASLIQPHLDFAVFARWPDYLEVPFFAMIGLPLYICASGSTPLIAVLIANGASPGAALALLLTGPATNITTFGVLADLFDKKRALVFGLTMTAVATVIGYLVNAFGRNIVSVADLGHQHVTDSPIANVSVLIFAALLALSLLRKGPRELTEQIFGAGKDDVFPHGHDEPTAHAPHHHEPVEEPSCCGH